MHLLGDVPSPLLLLPHRTPSSWRHLSRPSSRHAYLTRRTKSTPHRTFDWWRIHSTPPPQTPPLERSQDERARPERKEKPAQPHFLSNTTAPSPVVYFRGPVGTDVSQAGWLGGKGVVCKHTPPPTRRIWLVCAAVHTHIRFLRKRV